MELKVNDVRLRGCAFTLYPATQKSGVNGKNMLTLLKVALKKLDYFSDYKSMEKIDTENPNLPDTFLISDFDNQENELEDLIKIGLISRNGNKVSFEKKAIDIFEEAAKIQSDLYAKGVYYCTYCPLF